MMKKSIRVSKEDSLSRERFKYHSFLQDYHELLMETEEKRVRLEKTLQMKLQLLSEVKFLRRRCHQFTTTPETVPFKFKQDSHKIPSPSVPSHPRIQKMKSLPPQTSALLDLNEAFLSTGEEKEGFSVRQSPENGDGLNRFLWEGGEALSSDMMLSICRGSGIGLNRAVGKRKVSWQDQLALRV